ncbi:hypothetical protein EBR66_03855 [bacterium]|nr:hypothetical protein [bacterium]
MYVSIFTGKGGVGKTTNAVALALHKAQQGVHVGILDSDGGHSVGVTLGKESIPFNSIQEVNPHLKVGVIEPVNYISIADAKKRKMSVKKYLEQFPSDHGLIPLADMANAFFGIPSDTHMLQKFCGLVSLGTHLYETGTKHIVLDIEPTDGMTRLLKYSDATAHSLTNLQKKGKISLAALGAKWPDIATYLKGEYIQRADFFARRMLMTVDALKKALYFIVCIPEESPIKQTAKIRAVIEEFGAHVQGYVLNNVRDEADYCMRGLLPIDRPCIAVSRDQGLHTDPEEKRKALIHIGGYLSNNLGI